MVSILSKCMVTYGRVVLQKWASVLGHWRSSQKVSRGLEGLHPTPHPGPQNSGFKCWVRGLSWPPTGTVAFIKLLFLEIRFLYDFYTQLLVFSNRRGDENKLNDTMRNNQPNPESRTFYRTADLVSSTS